MSDQEVQAESVESTEVEAAPEAQSEAVEAAPKAEEKKIENEIKRLSKIKLRVDNEDIEEELPFDIEDVPEVVEYLKNNLQLSKVARKRMEESGRYKGAIEKIADMLENNPAELFTKAGKNPEDWAVAYLKQKLAEAEMDPKEKELHSAKQELEKIRAEREQERKSLEEKELKVLQDKIEAEYEQTLSSALEQTGLKSNPSAARKMAELMYIALQHNLEIPAQELAVYVKQDYINSMKEYLKASPDDFIEEIIGKDRISGFRKKDLKKLREAAEVTSNVKTNSTGNTSKVKESDKEKSSINLSDWLRGV